MNILFRIMPMLFFFVITAYIKPMEHGAQLPPEPVITLTSSDDKIYTIGIKFAEISPTIQGFFRDSESEHETAVFLADISSNDLELTILLIEELLMLRHSDWYNHIAFKEAKEALSVLLSTMPDVQLGRLMGFACFLDIAPLVNTIAYYLACKIDQQVEAESLDEAIFAIAGTINEATLEAIKKHFWLRKENVAECSVADYLVLYGEPHKRKDIVTEIYAERARAMHMTIEQFQLLFGDLAMDPAYAYVPEIKFDVIITDLYGLAWIREKAVVEHINLMGNRIKTLPAYGFNGFSNLEQILLSSNKIDVIEENAFVGLDNLKSLVLVKNNLMALPVYSFNRLTHLESLVLQGNKIKDFDISVFSPLRNLLDLDLSMNEIESIPPRLFQNLSQLTLLSLHDNRLNQVSPEMFCGLENVKQISLDKNPVESILPSTFSGMPKLTRLYIDFQNITPAEVYFRELYAIPEQLQLNSDDEDSGSE